MPKSLFVGIAAAVCWGLSTVLTKGLLSHFCPLPLLVIQLLWSNAFLWLILVLRRTPTLPLYQAFQFCLPGLLQPGLAFMLGTLGLCFTSASSDSLIWATETIVVIILSWKVLGEQINVHLLVLAALAMCGTILATAPTADSTAAPCPVLGNVIVFVGVCIAAVYTVITQRQLDKLEPLYLISLHQLSAFVFVVLIWCLWLPFGTDVREQPSYSAYLLAGFCGVTQFAIPFWLYFKAVKALGAAHSSLLLNLPPVFTLSGSFVFLNERLSIIQWMGAFLALIAVAGISLLKKKDATE